MDRYERHRWNVLMDVLRHADVYMGIGLLAKAMLIQLRRRLIDND